MKSADIRRKFLKFMQDKGHAIIPSAPVVPQNDPTTLFISAGMQPLIPYLLGEPHPAGKRLADIQKCIRTVDVDEVGDDSHATFIEMLGWWSLGDYFKEETIKQSWGFFVEELRLDASKLAATVFAGNDDAPKDEESATIWKQVGMPKERIFYCGREDNWWPETDHPGPCGPSTEIFYWVGEGEPESEPNKDDRWLEIGNNVLMGYERAEDKSVKAIAQQNVDTGLGFERVVCVVQGKSNVYETDLYEGILGKIRELATESDERAERIVADHLKAATFMIADGVRPSNTDRGYVLRRLVRRAIRQGRKLGIADLFATQVAEAVIVDFKEAYPELEREQKTITDEFEKEESKFAKTLDRGLKELGQLQQLEKVTGHELFHYFETYGLPLEVTLEELAAKSTTDSAAKKLAPERLRKEFDEAQKMHQEQSRAGAEQKFAGGLADHSEKVVRQHTATHLLLAALRDVLGDDVKQRGSNITKERLRFDFSYPEKLTDEQKNQVEALVNEWIKEDLPVVRQEMPREEAERLGAQMEFGHKYPDIVSVYCIGDPASARSMEFCGGPHVEHTGEIGTFTLQKQESVGAGVRRIKATIEP